MPVYYLKYRPQKISEVDGMAVREFLTRVLSKAPIPHAFLFSGPRGSGKTSAARIIAKAVNCPVRGKQKPAGQIEPCGRCDACLGITTGSYLDLIEIDGASNRGIDEIRALREKIKLAPTRGKYKVYIIDEAHMLTPEAFNALLKTLEEPPEHAIFILCTTQPKKLPDTIASRCLRLNFKKGTREEIIGCLKRVIRGENLKVPEEVLDLIAKTCDGSFRDAQKTLEQLAMEEGPITLEKAKKLLEVIEGVKTREFLALLSRKDLRGAIVFVNNFVELEGSLKILIQEALRQLRHLLFVKLGVEEEADFGFDFTQEEIKNLIELLARAYGELKLAVVPQLPLELAMVEFCGERGISVSDPEPEEVEETTNKEISDNSGVTFEVIQEKWSEVLAKIKPNNHSVAGLLKNCRPKDFDGKFLTIEAFYKFHQEKLSARKVRDLLEDILGEVLGIPAKIRCVMGERPKVGEEKTSDKGELIKTAEEIFGVKAS